MLLSELHARAIPAQWDSNKYKEEPNLKHVSKKKLVRDQIIPAKHSSGII